MCVCVGGGVGGGGNLRVIVVRLCEPVFRNLYNSYTWPLEKNKKKNKKKKKKTKKKTKKKQTYSYSWSSEILAYSYIAL